MAPVLGELLPSEFDAAVVGTGLVESMLAAALARSGLRVLHVDAFEQYGRDSAGLSLDAMIAYAEADHALRPLADVLEDHGEIPLAADSDAVRFHETKKKKKKKSKSVSSSTLVDEGAAAVVSEEEGDVVVKEATKAAGQAAARCAARRSVRKEALARCKRFNVDLNPRLHYARGEGTEAMIALGVAPYVEFNGVKATFYVSRDGEKTRVPSSKRDVFTSRDLAPSDKRKLMRFLQDALDASLGPSAAVLNEHDLTASRGLRRPQNKSVVVGDAKKLEDDADEADEDDDETSSFEARLRSRYALDTRMARVVTAAVALLAKEGASWTDGMAAVARHLSALGAHVGCDSPLMASLYGAAELPQAFCRACAVRGGVYALRTTARAIQLDGRVVTGLRFDDQVVSCAKVVLSADYAPPHFFATTDHTTRTYRRTVVSTPTTRFGDALPVALVVDTSSSVVRCVLFDESTYAVPEGLALQILHLETEADSVDAGLGALDEALSILQVQEDEALWCWSYSWPQHAPVVADLPPGVAVVRRLRPHFDVFQEVAHANDLAKDVLGLPAGVGHVDDHDADADDNAASPGPDDDDDMLQGLVDALEDQKKKKKAGEAPQAPADGVQDDDDDGMLQGLVDAALDKKEKKDNSNDNVEEVAPPSSAAAAEEEELSHVAPSSEELSHVAPSSAEEPTSGSSTSS